MFRPYCGPLLLSILFLIYGCSPDEELPDPSGSCGPEIPGGHYRLDRVAGSPQELEARLPPLTSFCLDIRTDASAGWVKVDDQNVAGPNLFKNRLQEVTVVVDGLDGSGPQASLRIAGRPGTFIEVSVRERVSLDDSEPGIQSADEAASIGTHWARYIGSRTPFAPYWSTARAAQVTPLHTDEGVITAYEVKLVSEDGSNAGAVILEADPQRPLLGTARMEGPSITELLTTLHFERTGTRLGDQSVFLWNKNGFGVVGLRYSDEQGQSHLLLDCLDCEEAVSFRDDDRLEPADPEEAIRRWTLTERQIRSGDGDLIGEMRQPIVCPVEGDPLCLSNEQSERIRRPGAKHVCGGFNAFPTYRQVKDGWPVPDSDMDEVCLTGCSPIAMATLLEFWDRRGYTYMMGDPLKRGGNDSHLSPEVVAKLRRLREVMGTDCNPTTDAGSTGIFAKEEIGNFFESIEVPGAPFLGPWEMENFVSDESARIYNLEVEISASRPVILSYWGTWRNGLEELPNNTHAINHATIVFGVWNDGDDDAQSDVMIVRTGWNNPDNGWPSGRMEPVAGIGRMEFWAFRPPQHHASLEPPYCQEFPDVTGHWAETPIETLACDCIVEGRWNGDFAVGENVTKAEFIKISMRLAFPELVNEYGPQDVDIDDVPSDHWASGYIKVALDNDVLDLLLNDENRLRPNEPIRRDEAVYVLTRAGLHSSTGHFPSLGRSIECSNAILDWPTYADVGPLNPAFSNIIGATLTCVVEGYELENGRREFRPEQFITRAEAAKVACMARFGFDSEECGTAGSTCQLSARCQ